MIGKSLSYYYMREDDVGYLNISLGRVNNAGEWEFYTENVDVPPDVPDRALDKVASEYFTNFVATKGQLFYKGQLKPNSTQYSHPLANA